MKRIGRSGYFASASGLAVTFAAAFAAEAAHANIKPAANAIAWFIASSRWVIRHLLYAGPLFLFRPGRIFSKRWLEQKRLALFTAFLKSATDIFT
jgi:hypothetical protein